MPIRTVSIIDCDNSSMVYNCNYEDVSICPRCDHALDPKYIGGCVASNDQSSTKDAYILFYCRNCQKVFLAEYAAKSKEYDAKSLSTTHRRALYPVAKRITAFSDGVKSLSPMFVKVYNEAEIAEQQSLLELAGCGYRKAVEYLVKDFACMKSPDEAEEIKSEFLGKTIKRIQELRLQTLAERAVWIGNDETHCFRKHEDLGIEDMKRFISAAVYYIDSELALEKALSISPK